MCVLTESMRRPALPGARAHPRWSSTAVALGRASSVPQALARRMPLVAHRRVNRQVGEAPLGDVRIGDELVVYD
jgi:hypothetical protein